MEIALQKGMDPGVWAHLTDWDEFVFPKEGKGMEWASLRWHVIASDQGQPAAHVGFDRFSVGAGGNTVSVVGVGGIVVRPEYQKKGIPARLFEKLHAECPLDVVAETFSLFCPDRLVPYYQKHGYRKIERDVCIRQFGRLTKTSFSFMARGKSLSITGKEITVSGPPW
jgi:predicted N-acetyltransferase YhbS